MLEPQSTVFFLLLVMVFIGVLWRMLVTRHLAVRIVAAILAFASAMTFGIATVNKYYDYYQTWGAVAADLGSQGVPATSLSTTAASGPVTKLAAVAGSHINVAFARRLGMTVRLRIHGPASNITRTVFVFLPPQYFWSGFYQKYRFPVIELIHGFPGQAQDWITVLGVNSTLDSMVGSHRVKPAVLVMPDANGGRGISLQCLNQQDGPKDDTYLATDLPRAIAGLLRVQKPGTGWGIAGYSEGGFCAANLGLQHGLVYSYAGVLSGYFRPSANQLTHPQRRVSPFGRDRHRARANTPADLLRSLPIGRPIPQFWLGAGREDPADVRSAEGFDQLLQLRQPNVTLRIVPDGAHTMLTWRQLMPPMLQWMTRSLARQVSIYNSPAARARRAAAAATAARVRGLGHRHGRLSRQHARLTHLPGRPVVRTRG
jgi:enterochelin esterase-like enzyme